ncbi:MAG: phosphatidate cytidylyltransferase [Paracoccaceae bacterium]
MNKPARQWDDLRARVLTAVVLVIIGGLAIWSGGLVLLLLVALIAGVMIWELVRMIAPDQALVAQTLPPIAVAAVYLAGSGLLPIWILLAPLVLGVVWLNASKKTFLLYGAVILLGALSVYTVRAQSGISVVLMILLVVVVTDIAGYFVGRTLGGPKFWPQISPKKTWSGTIGGWIAAACVGAFWVESQGLWVIAFCVALSFASQMGDIVESAIKRRAGVKDCSDLLPGHGGFLDRFDGMIAAFSVWSLIALFSGSLTGVF